MRNTPKAITPSLDPSELAAILAEVRRAILAVDADTGEYHPVRDIRLDAVASEETVAEQ